jgi:hypothetical protein
MNAAEQLTCGKGLAENSILAKTLAQLVAAMAENLDAHSKALDLTDQNSTSMGSLSRSSVNPLSNWRERQIRWPGIAICPWAGTTKRR